MGKRKDRSKTGHTKPSQWPWAKKVLLAVLAPLCVLVVLELACRLAGIYVPTSFLLRTADGNHYVPNQHFLRQFYTGDAAIGKILPFRTPVRKPNGAKRIVILGESAAQGTPEPAFGFARILQAMLRGSDPDRPVEVINAAMRGVDSTILLAATKDLIWLQPDLFVLYIGNNEIVGLHGARTSLGLAMVDLRWRIQQLAIGQVLTRLVPRGAGTQDMAYFRRQRVAMDSPIRQAVYNRLAKNIEQLCTLAIDNGAGVILCTIAVNLKDCPPFSSLHRPDLDRQGLASWQRIYTQAVEAQNEGRIGQAIELYLAANKIDDRSAELHYRLARCLEKIGQSHQAFREYQMARDLDALAFRADSQVNNIIRQSARRLDSVILVDIERTFAAEGIPGDGLFHDHVHLNLDGDYCVASCLLPAVRQALGLEGQAELPTLQYCVDELAYNRFAQVQMEAGILQTISMPPFLDQADHQQTIAIKARQVKAALEAITPQQIQAAKAIYDKALARDPNDWYIHRLYAYLALSQQDVKTAIEHLDAAVVLFPDHLPTVLLYASTLAQAGQTHQAIIQYRRVLRLDPGNPTTRGAIRSLSRR